MNLDTIKNLPPSVKMAGAGVIIFVVGAAAGRYTLPAKVETKIVTQTVTQTVTKADDKTDVNDHKNEHKDETIEIKPDGTKVIHVVTDDKGVETTKTDDKTDTTTKTDTKTTSDKIVENSKMDWILGFDVAKDVQNPLTGIYYGGSVDRRIIGPIYLGIDARSNGSSTQVGAGVKIGF